MRSKAFLNSFSFILYLIAAHGIAACGEKDQVAQSATPKQVVAEGDQDQNQGVDSMDNSNPEASSSTAEGESTVFVTLTAEDTRELIKYIRRHGPRTDIAGQLARDESSLADQVIVLEASPKKQKTLVKTRAKLEEVHRIRQNWLKLFPEVKKS